MAVSIVQAIAQGNGVATSWSLTLSSAPTVGNSMIILAGAMGTSMSAPTSAPTHVSDTLTTDLAWSGPSKNSSAWTYLALYSIASIADTTTSVTMPAISGATGSALWVYECSPGGLMLDGTPYSSFQTANSALDETDTYGSIPSSTSNIEILLVTRGTASSTNADDFSLTSSSPTLTKDLIVANVAGVNGDTFDTTNQTYSSAPTAVDHTSVSSARGVILAVYKAPAAANRPPSRIISQAVNRAAFYLDLSAALPKLRRDRARLQPLGLSTA